MIPQPARRVIDTPDEIEGPAPGFHSRRKAGAVPFDEGSNEFDPLEWQFFDFAGQAGSVDSARGNWFQGFLWGVVATLVGAVITVLIVVVLL